MFKDGLKEKMELKQVTTLANGRYLISNIKTDKTAIIRSGLLSSFSVGSLGSTYNEKVYYDTPDFFFAEKGINIYTVTINGSAKELIIKYDKESVKRIEFLKNMPTYFKLSIGKNDHINKYYNEIIDAIYRIFPMGINANIEDYLKMSTPQIKVFKKRDSYRVVNNTGLKMVMSFDISEYTQVSKRGKFTQPTMDIVCETARNAGDFDIFLKSVIRDFPQLIKIESNELSLARNNL